MGRAAAIGLDREEEEEERNREEERRLQMGLQTGLQMGLQTGLEDPFHRDAEIQGKPQYTDMLPEQAQRGEDERGEGDERDERDEGDGYSLIGFDRDRSTSSLAAEAIEGAIALGLSLGVGHREGREGVGHREGREGVGHRPSLPSLPSQLQVAGRGGGRGGGRVSGSAGTLGGLAALLESPQASMRRVATAAAATKQRSLGRYQKAALSRSGSQGGLRGLRKGDGEASWLAETLLTGIFQIF